LNARAGTKVEAPKSVGSRVHKPMVEFPGNYVLEVA